MNPFIFFRRPRQCSFIEGDLSRGEPQHSCPGRNLFGRSHRHMDCRCLPSRTTDALDFRWKFWEAPGGMILLSAAGSLPEVAITISAAAQHNLPLAAGNLIGGIALQTMVLVICDMFVKGKKPPSYLVGSLMPVLEASLVVVIVAIVFMGAMLPPSVALFGVSPASILIVVVWALGIAMLNKVNPKRQQTSRWFRPQRPLRGQFQWINLSSLEYTV